MPKTGKAYKIFYTATRELHSDMKLETVHGSYDGLCQMVRTGDAYIVDEFGVAFFNKSMGVPNYNPVNDGFCVIMNLQDAIKTLGAWREVFGGTEGKEYVIWEVGYEGGLGQHIEKSITGKMAPMTGIVERFWPIKPIAWYGRRKTLIDNYH